MEQRIGSSSQPLKGEPVTGAGFDPAFIPGLTPPVSGEPEEAEAERAAAETGDEGTDTGVASSKTGTLAGIRAGAGARESATDEDEDEDEDDEDEDEKTPEGPVFEASDRRAKIVADHRGVRLTLDDQSCEFGWDEIGAVETESPRFGKRFTITVHTPDGRWYPIEIEATARSRFEEWETQLDAVLDAYFEEGAEAAEGAEGGEPEAENAQDADATAEDADTKAED